MSKEEFLALRAMENQSVQLAFNDGADVKATLLSVTVDSDGSQHLLYDLAIESSHQSHSELTYYASGDELVSCVPLP